MSRKLHIDAIDNLELFLLNLRYKEGRMVEVEGNKPLLLNDPSVAYIVYSGVVDLFSVQTRGDEIIGHNNHLFRGRVGQLIMGVGQELHGGLNIRVSGMPGTRLIRLQKARLIALAQELEYSDLVIAMLNDWVIGLSSGVSNESLPKVYQLLESNQQVTVEIDHVVVPKKEVLWTQAEGGHLQLFNQQSLAWRNGAGHVPISPQAWATAEAQSTLDVIDTATFLQNDPEWKAVDQFHKLMMVAIALNRKREHLSDLERLQKKTEIEQEVMHQSLSHLTSPLQTSGLLASSVGHAYVGEQESLFTACRLVCDKLGVTLDAPPPVEEKLLLGKALQRILNHANLESRDVALRGVWWKDDHGALLGFLERGQKPVALLFDGRGYILVNPETNEKLRVDAQIAKEVMPMGYTFYTPFPNRALSLFDVLKYGFGGSRRDIISILGISLAISLLGLLPPIATGWLFNSVIPAAQVGLLWQIGAGLIVMSLAGAALRVARGIGFLRVQTRLDLNVQAALWNRLLNLPMSFFRDYTAGDLGTRAMGISSIRRALSGYVVTTIITSIFSVTNLILLFSYSGRLAVAAVGLVALSLVVTVVLCGLYLKYQRLSADIQGAVSGTVLQLLTGIVKIRIAGAENHAFHRWSNHFTEQKSVDYRGRLITNALSAYNGAAPLIASILIFSVIALASQAQLSTGDFLAFNLAFVQFMSAWVMLGGIMLSILPLIPMWDRLKPILDTLSEVSDDKEEVGELAGGIEVNHLTFGYGERGPTVLNDVTLTIEPGEFVAFVGPSGSGKSTLLRLLLGFETPDSGGVYYDEQDLNDLNVRSLRRQIGVVLQNATLMPQDIYANIVGTSPDHTLEDAWEAAELSGLADDIRQLPMGMNTVISERGGNFSGGQRQRLLIARALVTRPRVVFFDEATSALDNRTQTIVSESLERMKATRVVIAHRLSTIINADRIFVFDSGRIVQQGTYQELLDQEGPFAELAQRQMA